MWTFIEFLVIVNSEYFQIIYYIYWDNTEKNKKGKNVKFEKFSEKFSNFFIIVVYRKHKFEQH